MGLPTLYNKAALVYPKVDAKPIDVIIDYFKKPVRSSGDKFLILKASTGAGKSTALPYGLYKGFEFLQGKIVLTQPTRINVIKVAASMSNDTWNELEMGETVGFQTGQQSNTPKQGILYLTTGILLQQLKTLDTEKFMRKYSFIILDEVHTRSIEIDLCLFLLRSLIEKNYKREECPSVIMMSATFELPKYKKYFKTKEYIEVGGINFPIESHFLKYESSDIFKSVIDTIMLIEKASDKISDKDILVFASKMKTLKTLLERLEPLVDAKTKAIILTGATFAKRDKEIKELDIDIKKLPYNRRIILSTNVAETGITFDNLKYVIDIGKRNSVEYDPALNTTVKSLMPVTKGMATQRKGRVGRKFPGVWYPMYTEKSFNLLTEDQYPSIITNDNANTVLSLLCYFDEFTLKTLDLLDNIPAESLHMSLTKLYRLGMITLGNPKANLLTQLIVPTELGKIANKIRKLRVENIKMILAGYAYNVNVLDLITIAVFIESGWLSTAPSSRYFQFYDKNLDLENKHEARWLKEQYFIEYADTFLLILKIYDSIIDSISKGKLEDWCEANRKDVKSILELLTYRDEVVADILKYFKYEEDTKDDLSDVKRCFYEGYQCNLLTWTGKEYQSMTGLSIKKHLIFEKLLIFNDEITPPKYVITDEFVYSNTSSSSQVVYDFDVNYISVLDGFVL